MKISERIKAMHEHARAIATERTERATKLTPEECAAMFALITALQQITATDCPTV